MLSAEAKEYAKHNLGENDQVLENSLQEVQSFLKVNPHIKIETSDVRTILIFLRGCKFNIEKTKKKISNYHQIRLERTEWFQNRNPLDPAIDELLKIGVFLPLPDKDEQHRQIIIIRTGAHNPRKHKQNDVFKVGMMIMDYLMSTDNELSVYGNRAIFDMTNVTLLHALQMTPQMVKRAVGMWEAYPFRIKSLEFVNAPFHVNVVLDIFRSFMSKKLKERVFVKRGLPEFNANDHLPTELGGNGETYAALAENWQRTIVNNRDFFK